MHTLFIRILYLYEYDTMQQQGVKSFLAVVIGNIGSGKSTVVENIPKIRKDTWIIQEPVSEWREHGFLDQFYRDMSKYALPFQFYAFASRASLYKRIAWRNNDVYVADGHIISDRYVFAQSLKESGFISDSELKWYDQMYCNWRTIVPEMDANAWIYLKTKPETCLQRIHKRGRSEEAGIQLHYLSSLHEKFEQLILMAEFQSKVIIIDAERKEEEVAADIVRCIYRVQNEEQ